MFKDKDAELLFKLFIKENGLKSEISDTKHFKVCKLYTNRFWGGDKKTAHIDFNEKKYYVYGLPATNLKVLNYLNEHGHNLDFYIEDDHPKGGLDSFYV